jgi:hypothetical protein
MGQRAFIAMKVVPQDGKPARKMRFARAIFACSLDVRVRPRSSRVGRGVARCVW